MIHTRPSTSVTPAQEPPPRVEARAATRVEDFDVDLREHQISVTGIQPGPADIAWPFGELTELTRQFRWMSSSPRTARDGAPETAEGAVKDAEGAAKGPETADRDDVRHARPVSAAPDDLPASADELGKRLFDVVFGPGPARDAYFARSRSRICIRAHHPTLRSVPWELLYDRTRNIPLAAIDTGLLVRRVDPPPDPDRRPPGPTPVERLSVLAIGSNPSNSRLRPLDLASEESKIREALGIPREPLGSALSPNQVGELRWESKCDASGLQRLLEQNKGGYHVLHFAGHAGVEGDKAYLYLTATNGEVDKLDASHLGHLLRAHPTIRLVVLNACEGAVLPARDGTVPVATDNEAASIAERLAKQGVPAVIAMQSRIQDLTAVRFARELYTCLARLEPVDVAVKTARLALRHPDATTGEWAIPVLTLAVDDPRLFVEKRRWPVVVAGLVAVALAVAGVLAPYIFPQLLGSGRSASAQEVPAGPVSQPSLLLQVDEDLRGDPASSDYHLDGAIALGTDPAIDARCKGVFYCANVGDLGFVPIPMNGVWIVRKGAALPLVEPGKEPPATLSVTGDIPPHCPKAVHRRAPDETFKSVDSLMFEYTHKDARGIVKCVVTNDK